VLDKTPAYNMGDDTQSTIQGMYKEEEYNKLPHTGIP
jgi:hypothetical protein